MSRFSVALLPQAQQELQDAFLWYAERSPLAAQAFRSTTFEAINRLAHDADVWPGDASGIRRLVLRRFPYTIHFDLSGQQVTVLAVAHQRRRPGYWDQRHRPAR